MSGTSILLRLPGAVGRKSIGWTGEIGCITNFLGKALLATLRRPFRGRQIVDQIAFIGNRSLSIILLSSSFTGMVLVLQGYNALARFGGEVYLGPLVSLSLVRELAPVLGALMVTARGGSAIAATIGSMRISEQIDALQAMSVDPVQYLVGPRLLAALISLPLLTTLFNLIGIGAAALFGATVLGLDASAFFSSVRDAVEWSDVSIGLYKSLAFAVLIVWIASQRGYVASGGAEGVGRATTEAVVAITVLVVAVDYVMTALLF